MKNILIKNKFYLIISLALIFYLLILSALELVSSISYKTITILNLIWMLGTFFALGFYKGKSYKAKGLLKGFRFGLIISFILFLIKLLFIDRKIFDISLIYYLILSISCALGSAISINKKRN